MSGAAPVEIREEPIERLDAHARIPIAFLVERVVEVRRRDDGGFALSERAVATPWRKDYDALPGNRPTDWPRRFDVSRWGLLAALRAGRRDAKRRVGGAVVAFGTPGVELLEGRDDLAVLFDLRVAPELRGRGVGTALFLAAERWARARGCRELKVETQQVNARACAFYAARGCRLDAVDPRAYPELPGEVQLLFRKAL